MTTTITDYAAIADTIQEELGRRFRASSDLLNRPGRSVACKVDPWYCLAPYPAFVQVAARWAGRLPSAAETALVKTGNLITGRGAGEHAITLRLTWPGVPPTRTRVCILHSSFVDRAMKLYAGLEELPVSDLRIAADERERVDAFLDGLTRVAGLAYAG
jgi:hypothetical protein